MWLDHLWGSASSMWVADGKGSCLPSCGLARRRPQPAAGRMSGVRRNLMMDSGRRAEGKQSTGEAAWRSREWGGGRRLAS